MSKKDKKKKEKLTLRQRMMLLWIKLMSPSNLMEAKTSVEDNILLEESKNRKGIAKFLNMPVVGRFIMLLTTAILCLACIQAATYAYSTLHNHQVLVAIQKENALAAVPVQEIKDTSELGEIGDTVVTVYGDEGKLVQVYPATHSDASSHGKGYWFAENKALIRPATLTEIWRASGTSGAFPSILWLATLIVLIGSRSFFEGSWLDIKVKRRQWVLQILNAFLVILYWLLFVTPLIA